MEEMWIGQDEYMEETRQIHEKNMTTTLIAITNKTWWY